ncbi:MAG TPA: nucleotidyltransferase domain-containing protein [Acidimicrobiia bacterium]|nr:nucleotidyltransferase domain-containing protein [Acidimicrobiia bacterium]
MLSLLFGQPDRSYKTMELIRLVGAGSGAVQRELDRLVASRLVTVTEIDGQKRFAANTEAPIFAELRSIVDKTAGVPEVLQAALATLGPAVRYAVLYGSEAKGTAHAMSDLDLLVVADDLPLERVFAAVEPAEARLGRRVSPTMYTTAEFLRRRRAKHPFLTKVLAGRHVVLLGSEDAISPR